jgi:hypothetical protein
LFLRIIVCFGALIFVEASFREHRPAPTIAFGTIAILFNPVLPMDLPRKEWLLLDLATIAAFAVGLGFWLTELRRRVSITRTSTTTPTRLHMESSDKLFRDDLSSHEIKSMSNEELVLWSTRPRDSAAISAKRWMMLRVTCLVAATVYFSLSGIAAEYAHLTVFLFLLFGYEFAYYNLRQERAERDDTQARHAWFDRLKEFERRQNRK